MKFQFEFTFEQAVLLLKLVDNTPLPHNQSRPLVDYMVSEISKQQDAEVQRLQQQDQQNKDKQVTDEQH